MGESDVDKINVGLVCIVVALVFFIVGLIANSVSSLVKFQSFDQLAIIIGFLLILFTFFCIIYCGYSKNQDLNRGELRRAIAATFVLTLIFLLFFSIATEFEENEIVNTFINFVGIVIGFYFGARTAEGKPNANSNSCKPGDNSNTGDSPEEMAGI